MGRRLVQYVWLSDPDTGTPVGFGPDDHVPSWAEELIENPDAWGEGEGATPKRLHSDNAGQSRADVPDPGGSSSPPAGGGDGPPPMVGAGSGRDAWAAYADAKGFQVEDGDKRAGIIAALEAAGVPTRKTD